MSPAAERYIEQLKAGNASPDVVTAAIEVTRLAWVDTAEQGRCGLKELLNIVLAWEAKQYTQDRYGK
jgi:hypothetical protein